MLPVTGTFNEGAGNSLVNRLSEEGEEGGGDGMLVKLGATTCNAILSSIIVLESVTTLQVYIMSPLSFTLVAFSITME